MSNPINIFIAYAREDQAYLNELRSHLRIMERNQTIKIWYDGEIIAGQKWNDEIERELETADIFLMLLSADFINSDYAYGKEMKQALERHERGEATVIPIVARDCAWELTPLAELQAPMQGKALSSVNAEQRQSLYKSIVLDINKAVTKRKKEEENLNRYFADQDAWKNALSLNSINAYNRYLEQHPAGNYAVQARDAITDIQRRQQKEKESIERKAWQQAQRLKSVEGFEDYLQKYPDGQFVKNAIDAIDNSSNRSQKAPEVIFQMLIMGIILIILSTVIWQNIHKESESTGDPSKTTQNPKSTEETKIDETTEHINTNLTSPTGDYLVLAGTFAVLQKAEIHAENIRDKGYTSARVERFDKGAYAVVLVDKFDNEYEATKLVSEMKDKHNIKCYVKSILSPSKYGDEYKGTLYATDELPLEGVEVKCINCVYTKGVISDRNGKFSLPLKLKGEQSSIRYIELSFRYKHQTNKAISKPNKLDFEIPKFIR